MLITLPTELIMEILILVNYKYIKSCCCTCNKLYYMTNKIIKHKQQLSKGFPRPEGKAKVIKIGKDIVKLKDDRWSISPAYEALETVKNLKLYILFFKQVK